MENELEGSISKNTSELEERQPRLALAILMAVIMGLVGCALFILLYYIGIIAWVAGFALVLASAWGYKKFNLKLDTKGYIIVAVVAVVEILISLFIGLAIDCTVVFEVSFGESFSLLMELINEYPEIKSAVISDAIFSLISIAVGFVLLVSNERRKARMIKKEEELAKEAEEKANSGATENEDADRYDVNVETESIDDDEDEDDDDDAELIPEDDDDKTESGMEY